MSCHLLPQHLADTLVVVRCWQSPATATRIVLQCIVTTAAHDVGSIPSVASIGQLRGVPCVLRSCVSTRCARVVRGMAVL